MTNVSQVGTPSALATSTGLSSGTGSVTGTWSGTQPRTAGDLLVAVFYAGDSSTAAASTLSTGSGWTKTKEQVTGASVLAIWTKIATGADAAPGFSSALVGTAGKGGVGVYLMELTANDGTTPVLVSGAIGGTGTSLVVPSGGTVTVVGCYAIAAAMNTIFTAGTTSFTRSATFTNQVNNGASSLNEHVNIDIQANPATGAAISDTIGGLGSVTDAAGAMIVVQPTTSTSVTVTGVVSDVASASPAGIVGITVAGVVSNTTSASPAGVVGVTVSGVVSNVTSASPAGSVGIKVLGVVSNVTSASPAGVVGIKVTGVVSNVTSASPAGTVTGSANVTGVVSNTTSASPAGSVGIKVNGVVSNVLSASPAGSVGIKVTGVVSNVTSASPAGTVTGSANVIGVVSRVTSASPAGTVSGTANVIGVVSNVTSASPAGSFVSNVTVHGVVSNVTSASPAGKVPRKIFDFGGSTAADKDQFDGIATLASPVYNGSATIVSPLYNGTASNNLYDGTISQLTYNGTADVEPVYNGIATMATVFDGTTEGFIMQTQNVTLGEFNDELVNVAIKDSGGSAVNLTGKTLKAYLKTAAGVSDSDPSTIVLASGGAINWVSQSGGTAQVTIAHADISDLSVGFWRVDVVDGSGNQNTAIQGTVTITPL